MVRLLERVLWRRGMHMLWHHKGSCYAIRGYFQSVTSTANQYLKRVVTELGEVDPGTYVYYGSSARTVETGDLLEVSGRKYRVCRAEDVFDRKGPAYRWALCRAAAEEDAWGS
jgi:hypothetical protein